ncbi:MAG: hypothetical protein Hals2KO_20430 [Halioglobus sp.]
MLYPALRNVPSWFSATSSLLFAAAHVGDCMQYIERWIALSPCYVTRTGKREPVASDEKRLKALDAQ